MKKLLTLALAVVALAAFTGPSVAQGAQKKDQQKSPSTSSETAAKNSGHATEQVMTGEVLSVNPGDKTFTVMPTGKSVSIIFHDDAGAEKALLKVGDVIDVNYTQATGGPMVAKMTKIRSTKSNASERQGAPANKVMTGKVLSVNKETNAFTVMTKGNKVVFAMKKGDALPEVGKILDITYVQTTPGGTFGVINLNSSRSNIY
jgi:hypothetical protein